MKLNRLLTIFTFSIFFFGIQSCQNPALAETYFPGGKEKNLANKKLLLEQIERAKNEQTSWDSNDLINAVNSNVNNRKILKLASRTPRLNLALYYAASEFSPPICGSESSFLLRFVDRENFNLENYLVQLLNEKSILPQVSKGPLESERRELLMEYEKSGSRWIDSLAFLDHLVINGASRDLILKELTYWKKGLEILKSVPQDPLIAEKLELSTKAKTLVNSMRSQINEIENVFRNGNTDKTDDLYWNLLKTAEKTREPKIILRTIQCYKTFLWGIKYRTREGLYEKRFKYVDRLEEKLKS